MPNGDSPEDNIAFARSLLLAVDAADADAVERLVHPDALFLKGGFVCRGPQGLVDLWRAMHWRLSGVNFPPTGGVDLIVETIDASDNSATILAYLQRETDPALEPTLAGLTVSFSGDVVAGGTFVFADQAAVDRHLLELTPAHVTERASPTAGARLLVVADEWSDDEAGVDVQLDAGAPWPWTIGIAAAEFVREEPFESEFRRRIDAAIRAVPGITDVTEEDREVWLARGRADGQALLASIVDVLDEMSEQIEAAMREGE